MHGSLQQTLARSFVDTQNPASITRQASVTDPAMNPDHPHSDRPFFVLHLRIGDHKSTFAPAALIALTPEARTSGFLKRISARHARILLALLTCLTANGEPLASARQVASALGVPIPMATVWLELLCIRRYRGEPILYRLRREQGLTLYTISHMHIHHISPQPEDITHNLARAAGTEPIRAHVRATYAVPADEAEHHVSRQLGVHPEERAATDEAWVFRQLRYLKFRREDIVALVDTFGIEKLKQQLLWLPDRPAKHPAKFLVTALLNSYGPPRRLKDVLGAYRFGRSSAIDRQPPAVSPVEESSND